MPHIFLIPHNTKIKIFKTIYVTILQIYFYDYVYILSRLIMYINVRELRLLKTKTKLIYEISDYSKICHFFYFYTSRVRAHTHTL